MVHNPSVQFFDPILDCLEGRPRFTMTILVFFYFVAEGSPLQGFVKAAGA